MDKLINNEDRSFVDGCIERLVRDNFADSAEYVLK